MTTTNATPAKTLVKELETSLGYLRKTLSVFGEEDSGFAPNPQLFTVAGHVAHAADSVDWFVEGAFGKGWDMDFATMESKVRAVASLAEASAWLERAFAAAAEAVQSAPAGALGEPIPDRRIMGGAPRAAVATAIVDHTAHHRGALSVYARLLGKTPVMPYG